VHSDYTALDSNTIPVGNVHCHFASLRPNYHGAVWCTGSLLISVPQSSRNSRILISVKS